MSIADCLAWLRGEASFARGVHPPTRKTLAAERPIEVLPSPAIVTVPLRQHAGAAARAVCPPRSRVEVGSLIGQEDESAAVSARVHASLAGRVQPLVGVTLPNGRHSLAVPIAADEGHSRTGAAEPQGIDWFERLYGGSWHVEDQQRYFPRDIRAAVQQAGIVGLGGAGFPTHLKLMPQATRPAHTLLLNGCECEPYLTADQRLMVEAPAAVVTGLLLAVKAIGCERAVIAVEENKPQAIAALRGAVAQLDDQGRTIVRVCQTKYPMGGERQLIPAVFGIEVPTGGFPLDVGIVVLNVATAAAIAAAVLRGHKLTHRVVSVSGEGIRQPKNLLAPIGTALAELIAACGGLTDEACRVIAGGPMMGFTVTDLSVPLTKGTGGLTVLTRRQLAASEQTACIRCGRCLDVCPLGLAPTRIAHAVRHGQLELAEQYDMMACCDCGCCAYVCPAQIPLVQYIRQGKSQRLRRTD